MWILWSVLALGLIVLILADCFETLIMPRRVTRPYRLTRFFYTFTWIPYRAWALSLDTPKQRIGALGMFGPLSLLLLLSVWSLGLIFGFGLWQWARSEPLRDGVVGDLSTYLYMSGVTLLTLGYGDFTPTTALGQLIAVIEAGVGFAFLAMVIGYLPTLWQAFESREVSVGLLDARAGSPPSAGQLLARVAAQSDPHVLDAILKEWEVWSAQTLESHLSFPVLSFYRSQHDNQSWLVAVTAVLDACTLLIASGEGRSPYQAQLTFAMSRHLLVDLALIFKAQPAPVDHHRFAPEMFERLRADLDGTPLQLPHSPAVTAKIAELRELYEPFAAALARHLAVTLPTLWPETPHPDNWQTSVWQPRAIPFRQLAQLEPDENEHFK